MAGRKEAARPATRAVRPRTASKRTGKSRRTRTTNVGALEVRELQRLDDIRRELERVSKGPLRWNADPDEVQRSVAQLVLTLVEFIRALLERQAIRRMDAGTLTRDETEKIGRALMQLERTVHDMARRFGIDPEDLNLDLGPLGTLK